MISYQKYFSKCKTRDALRLFSLFKTKKFTSGVSNNKVFHGFFARCKLVDEGRIMLATFI
jgi:hypothetical protein